MSDLIIRFHDEALDAFDWLVVQDDEVSRSLQWRSGSESDLGDLISSQDTEVVLAIPQQCVLMTHFEVPAKASRQILSSIEFQIEDQLGDDIDRQHFATANIVNNSVPIVVIKKSIMQRCQALQKKFNMTISTIIPELFLCPWSGHQGELSVLESECGLILRFGHYQGFKCQSSLLKSMMDQLNRQYPIEQVNYFYTENDVYKAIKVEGYESQKANPTVEHLNDPKTINFDLRQREFKRSSVWGALLKPWKWVATLFFAFLMVFTYNKLAHLNDLEGQLNDIRLSQYAVVKAYLPLGTAKSDNLKKKLIARIKQSKTNVGDNGFLSQLVIFTKAKQRYSSVMITKINFQKSRLSIDINSTKLSDVEALVKTLESSALTVKLENLTIKPEFSSGRLLLGN